MQMLETAALYCGVNILLLLVLSVMVGGARGKHKVLLGDGGVDPMHRAIRAHGNAAEYIPAGLVGLLGLALFDPATPIWLLHAGGLTLTVGRILHPIGIYQGGVSPFRVIGIMLTWISFLLIGGGLIYVATAQQL